MLDVKSLLKWKKRLKTITKLALPSRSLKYFPPAFTLRDPILSLVHRNRLNGNRCALFLFHLEQAPFLNAASAEDERVFYLKLQALFEHTVRRFLREEDILGMKSLRAGDIAVFVRFRQDADYDHIHFELSAMTRRLEETMIKQSGSHSLLAFGTGAVLIDNETVDMQEAMLSAFDHATAIATKRVSTHFALHRELLMDIIRNESISVVTQPIMCLRTGEVFGWELLSRGPRHSPLHAPTDLFALAHEANQLTEIEALVIKKALNEIAERHIQEQVFINITPVTLGDPRLLERILEWMQAYPQISPQQIIFEITERQAVNDFTQMAAIVAAYRAHGFRFAVDDAGAGYSSLQSITELTPDMIKIDRSVIQNIDSASVKQTLLQALVFFAKAVNCRIIAEGVEREEEANVLFRNDVHMGQGYYFARPEPMPSGDSRERHYAGAKEKVIRHLQASSA
ncbi:EAL domain-containing protein [Paenibacillus sp. MBLB4367]|uniref:EAL domain-containing protein n=1 Tax=Paenibacillus sp. MBLB4367 TaxID=3384767 RepID=UPI003907FA89